MKPISCIRLTALAGSLLLLMSGCSKTSAPSQTGASTAAPSASSSTTALAVQTTASSTTTTTGRPTTAPSSQVATRPTVAPAIVPASELLGLSYGELLQKMGNTYYVVQQRGHADVACSLVNTNRFPHYEILEADGAFVDWSYGMSLIGTNTPGKPEAIKNNQMVTAVYVHTGGHMTDTASVGMTVRELQAIWPALSDMTIMYDFAALFNRSFYGMLTTTSNGAPTTLYVDLTTAAAKQALSAQNITLNDSTRHVWLGKTVSLPDLPVTGALLKLNRRG